MAFRLWLIALVPINYSFDGFQRWAGRDHLLIQDWLPATQSLVWLTVQLGGGITAVRVLMAVVAAGAVAAVLVLAGQLGGPKAPWLALPVALFGPFAVWSGVLYQEGSFLFLVCAALSVGLAARSRGQGWRLLGDVLAGGVALVRYEGWPFVLLWLAWRREPKALVALWGAGLWLCIKALGLAPHRPSPIDYADWNGLAERFDPAVYLESLDGLMWHGLNSGGLHIFVGGLVGLGLALRDRRPGAGLLGLMLGVQLAALAGWLAGLETASVRMQNIPVMLAAPFAALLMARVWDWRQDKLGWGVRGALILGLGLLSSWTVDQATSNAKNTLRSKRWEVALAQEMQACTDCVWWVRPRKGLGTRSRHDACEILLGITELRHGQDFWCAPWVEQQPPGITHQAKWKKGGYQSGPVVGTP